MAKHFDRRAIRRDVMRLLKNHGKKTFRPKEISKRLNYRDNDQYRALRDVLTEMEASGVIQKAGRGQYSYRTGPMHREGVLSVHRDGFGFVRTDDDEEDVYVGPTRMGTALDGDHVRLALLAGSRGDRRQEGEVTEIIERKRTQTVGTFRKSRHFGFVVSDDLRLTHDIYVPENGVNGASEGDKVVVSIDSFDDPKGSPEGRILKVIGPSDDPDVKMIALAMSQDVRIDFPEEVLRETETVSDILDEKEVSRRLDLRDRTVFTIDPDDARDFDDAIHIIQLENGNYEIGVHIADVSYYLKSGSALDREALERATSVYLVDRVIPMLPEKLSNMVCSLRPDEDKFTYSVIMEVSTTGVVRQYEIRETVIRSKARLTYEDAQQIIEEENRRNLVAKDLLKAASLARTLRKKRFEAGSVNFSTPEVKVILDEKGEPVEIIRKKLGEANHLIEELMLLANRTVAGHISRTDEKPLPFVYRVHDRPDPEKIQILAEYVRAFGYRLILKRGNVDSKELNRLLQQVEGAPEESVIEEAALRSMAKAVYSTGNIGHYGLGFRHYTHFTSPIRRYPDLLVHRLLKAYGGGRSGWDAQELSEQCDHCSDKERAAQVAERDSVKMKQVEYMARHLNEHFTGVVSSVTKFGVFVELDSVLVEGLVHVRDMDDDYYEYDEKTYTLNGMDTGRTIRLGDKVSVIVTKTDVENRQIDFVFAD